MSMSGVLTTAFLKPSAAAWWSHKTTLVCLLLVAVESGEFVHLDLNCKKALSLGISHINSHCRSKRRVDRLSRPNEHCHLSSLQL